MNRLASILIGARVLVPTALLSAAFFVAALWLPNAAANVALTAATLLAGVWAGLISWRLHRIGHAAQRIHESIRHSGLATHLPEMRSQLMHVRKRVTTLHTEFADFNRGPRTNTTGTQASDSYSNSTPALPLDVESELLCRLAAIDCDETGVSRLAAAVLRARLHDLEVDAPAYIGDASFRQLVTRISGDYPLGYWTRHNDDTRLELAHIDLLAVNASSARDAVWQGTLLGDAEIWLFGSIADRERVLTAMRTADPSVERTVLPQYCEGITVVRKAAA